LSSVQSVSRIKLEVKNPHKCETLSNPTISSLGKACFVCEHEDSTSVPSNAQSNCSVCGPRAQLDRSNAQRILEHMGAHVLHDPSLDRTQEMCGLCLRPSPMCRIRLRKGRGSSAGYNVDREKSACTNLIRFNYASAADSSSRSPCTNVPIICPLCPKSSPAVWKYSLHIHFRHRHKITVPASFPIQVHISESEKDAMKVIWDARLKVQKARRSRKSKMAIPMVISQAHSSRLALRCGDLLSNIYSIISFVAVLL
jgi:hypothetical protein